MSKIAMRSNTKAVLQPSFRAFISNECTTKMSTLHFRFRVNQSFLGYPGHPITVPSAQVNYKLLESEWLHQGEFIVILPKGERLAAKMYRGVAGYGPYYQLQIRGYNRAIPRYIEVGSYLFVVLARMRRKNYAILEQIVL